MERKRDVASPTPEQATGVALPACGAALQKDTVGAVAFCGTKIDMAIPMVCPPENHAQPARRGGRCDFRRTGSGYKIYDIMQPNFMQSRAALRQRIRPFPGPIFRRRARVISMSCRRLGRIGQLERAVRTNGQHLSMHRLWIDEYQVRAYATLSTSIKINALSP